jgi:hypothetical protein
MDYYRTLSSLRRFPPAQGQVGDAQQCIVPIDPARQARVCKPGGSFPINQRRLQGSRPAERSSISIRNAIRITPTQGNR